MIIDGGLPKGRVLLTGGRAPAALELARLLAAAGWTVYAADSLRYTLCGASRAVRRSFTVPAPGYDAAGFAEALETIIRREQIDWLVPTCEEIFYVAQAAERLGRWCRIAAPPWKQLAMLHSKLAFIRCAASHGFDVPYTERLAAGTALGGDLPLPLPAELLPEPLRPDRPLGVDGYVLKPEFSRFASRVRIVVPEAESNTKRSRGNRPEDRSTLNTPPPGKRGEAQDRTHSDRMNATGGPEAARCEPWGKAPELSPEWKRKSGTSGNVAWIIQQRIAGRSLCTYSIAREGVLTAHAAYAALHTAGGGACIYFEPLAHAGLLEWVRRFVRLERLTGQIAFDFIETADGRLYPIECNPRTTSGIHLFRPADGLDAALLGDAPPGAAELAQPRQGVKRMLGLPMLAYGLRGSATGGVRKWFGRFVRAQDAVFRWSDPLPYAAQLPLLEELRRVAARRRLTLMQASTHDIEWNGEER